MAYFPFMIDLKNKKCVIGGGGNVAYRKLQAMCEYGANCVLIAANVCDSILEYAKSNSDRINVIQKNIEIEDINNNSDVYVVIMATDDEAVNKEIADYCQVNRILVNVVDVKEECGFIFPAIHRQGEVVVAVSTSGESPLLAAHIRDDIADNISGEYGQVSKSLGKVREYVIEHTEPKDRKKVFAKLIELGMESQGKLDREVVDEVITAIKNKI